MSAFPSCAPEHQGTPYKVSLQSQILKFEWDQGPCFLWELATSGFFILWTCESGCLMVY